MIVLDASAAVELVLVTPRGKRLAARLGATRVSLHAPHLVDPEVTHVLRRYVLGGAIPEERARLALEHLALLELERYPHEPLLPRMWALRANVTAYDAAYVALAEALAAPLVTADGRLAAAPGVATRIEVVA